MTGKLIHKDVGSVLNEIEYDATDAHELASQAIGDLVYADAASGGLDGLAIGSTGQVLHVASGKPAWSDNLDLPGTLDVTGAVTLDSTLSVATSVSLADSVPLNLGASSDAVLQHDGSNLTLAITTGDFHITGNVGIGIASPDGALHVMTDSAGAVSAHANADDFAVESSGSTGITILSGNANTGNIYFGDANDNNAGRVVYDHSLGDLSFWVEGSEIAAFRSSGLLIGTELTTPATTAIDLTIGSGDDAGISLQSTTAGHIHFGDASDADAGRIVYSHSDNSLSLWTNATQAVDIDSSGNMNLRGGTLTVNNTTSLEGTVHAFSASAGTVTASTSADEVVAENSGDGGISILTPNTAVGNIFFGDPDDSDAGAIVYTHSNDSMLFKLSSTSKMRLIDSRLELFDFTGNSFQGQGLTVSQGAEDDEILSLKSSDVSHSFTSITEADTYGFVTKHTGANGGLVIEGFNDGTIVTGLTLVGNSSSMDSAKSALGRGAVEIHGYTANGAGRQGITALNGNILVVGNGGTQNAVMMVDIEGDIHIDGTVTSFDLFDDLNLLRAFDWATADRSTLIENEWDKYVQYNEADLVEAGILGAPRSEGGLINMAKLQRLHNGALWQVGSLLKEVTARLAVAENKLKALEA